jgi:predicted ester cyclase
MMRSFLMGAAAAALLVGGACDKTEPTGPDTTGKVTSKPESKPMSGPATMAAAPKGEELANMFKECWKRFSTKDAKFSECYAADAVAEFPGSVMGPEKVSGDKAVVDNAMTYKTAFPDMAGEPQIVLVNGNNVAAVVRVSGTNSGPMKGPAGEMPATNKKVGYMLAHFAELGADGKVKHDAIYSDQGSLMGQLGMLPPGAPFRPTVDKDLANKVTVVAKDDKVEQDNLALAKKMDEAMNKHDTAFFAAGYADDAVMRNMGDAEDTTGKAKIEEGMKMMFGSFPDLKFQHNNQWAAGDWVVMTGVMTGTNKGDMGPKMKATNKAVTVPYAELVRFEGGKVKEDLIFFNGALFMQQLGMGGPPGGAPASAPASK